jgi:hypothetical protein
VKHEEELMVRCPFRILVFLAGMSLYADGSGGGTQVVVNGSFENGLSSWTAAPSAGNGAGAICGFNDSTASGTETITGTPSFAPSAGTYLAMGSAQNGMTAISSCVLYQDVAIPAGATTATITLSWGLKYIDGTVADSAALVVGLYSSTATVPYYIAPSLNSLTYLEPSASSTVLVPGTTGSFDVSSLAGKTGRLALFIAIDPLGTGPAAIGGFDNVQMTVQGLPVITSVSPSSGPGSGGNTVTITGSFFTGATNVTFGGVAASSFTVVSDTSITATVPSGMGSMVSVAVTAPGGTSAANTLYSYVIATPTLGEWGLLTMAALLILFVWFKFRREDAPRAA